MRLSRVTPGTATPRPCVAFHGTTEGLWWSDGHDFSTGRLSSTSSNSSCGSSEYSGEVIPHPPGKCCLARGHGGDSAPSPSTANLTGGLPKSDPGHWWASFFFGKTTHPAMTTVSESPESSGALRVTTGPMACGLVPGAGRRRHASEPSSGPSA
uniref:Pancreatic progenitor cell differentiation and proliferation factor n=1 Tax=Bubo bubo TaxID=30461 RepID=A0A8C0EQL3_BUBBB